MHPNSLGGGVVALSKVKSSRHNLISYQWILNRNHFEEHTERRIGLQKNSHKKAAKSVLIALPSMKRNAPDQLQHRERKEEPRAVRPVRNEARGARIDAEMF